MRRAYTRKPGAEEMISPPLLHIVMLTAIGFEIDMHCMRTHAEGGISLSLAIYSRNIETDVRILSEAYALNLM